MNIRKTGNEDGRKKQYKRFTMDGMKVNVLLSTASSESDSDD